MACSKLRNDRYRSQGQLGGQGELADNPVEDETGSLLLAFNGMTPAHQWVPESEAVELLAIKLSALRSMRRDGRLTPGTHWVRATGTANGPVTYNLTEIRAWQAQCTKEMVAAEAKRRDEAQQQRLQAVETYDEAGLKKLIAEVQS